MHNSPILHFLDQVFLNTFDSNEELVDAMLCSMNLLPGFAWMPRPYCYEGRRGCYVDGGNQQAVTALDAVMDIPVRVFARPCRETSIAPGHVCLFAVSLLIESFFSFSFFFLVKVLLFKGEDIAGRVPSHDPICLSPIDADTWHAHARMTA